MTPPPDTSRRVGQKASTRRHPAREPATETAPACQATLRTSTRATSSRFGGVSVASIYCRTAIAAGRSSIKLAWLRASTRTPPACSPTERPVCSRATTRHPTAAMSSAKQRWSTPRCQPEAAPDPRAVRAAGRRVAAQQTRRTPSGITRRALARRHGLASTTFPIPRARRRPTPHRPRGARRRGARIRSGMVEINGDGRPARPVATASARYKRLSTGGLMTHLDTRVRAAGFATIIGQGS